MGYNGVEEAFDLLLDELESALRSEDRAGSDAFARGDHEGVQAALAKAERIKRTLQAVQDLRRQWSGGGEEPRTRRRVSRGSGEVTSIQWFCLPVLKALVELGGSGSQSEVFRQMEPAVAPYLKDGDRRVLKDGTIRWRGAAAWARYMMVQAGLLRNDSPHGIWEITEEGRRYLKEHEGEDQ